MYGAAAFVGAMLVVSAALVLLDRISWDRPPLELTAFSGSRPGEVILEWRGGPAGVINWQFRLQRHPEDEDAEWRDMPLERIGALERTGPTTLRLLGVLPERVDTYVSIRPRGGGPEAADWIVVPPAGSDGFVRSIGRVERGGTFRLGWTDYLFTVPDRGRWNAFQIPEDPYDVISVVEEETGAYVWLDPRTATEATWWEAESYRARARTRVPAERAAYRLVGEIVASIRYQPEDSDPAIRAINGGAAGEVLVEWKPLQNATRWEYRIGERSDRRADSSTEDITWRPWSELPLGTHRLRIVFESRPVRWRVEVRPQTSQEPGPPRALWVDPATTAPDGLPELQHEALHEGGHQYRLGSYVLDVPAAMLLRVQHYVLALEVRNPATAQPLVSRDPLVAGFSAPVDGSDLGPANPAFRTLLMDEASGSYVVLDGRTQEVLERRARPHPHGADAEAMLDELLGSMQYVPTELRAPLLALAGGGAGEVVLRLVPGSRNVTHWQYRARRTEQEPGVPAAGEWSAWADVPRSAGSTTSHRVRGLRPGLAHEFEVRPLTATGPGDVHQTRIEVPQVGPGGVPLVRGFVESGRTFQLAGSTVTFDVPCGMLVHVGRAEPYDLDGADNFVPSMVIRDIGSGSYLWVSPRREEQRRWITPHTEGPGVNALFDQIVDSLGSGPMVPGVE